MKNPLQENIKSWFAIREGHLPKIQFTENGEWHNVSTGDVNYLLEVANNNIGNATIKPQESYSEQSFGYYIGLWLDRYIREGLSKKMLFDLRNKLNGVRFYHILNPAIPSRGEPLPHWEFQADMETFHDSEAEAAYAFAHQLTFDGFPGLKRCKKKECLRFFIRRRDAQWCSDKCSSHDRVRRMRKKKKRNQ